MANQRANYMLAPRSSEIRRQHGASIDSAFEDIPSRESLFKRVKSKLSNIGKSLISAIFRDPSLPMTQESEDYNRIAGFKPALISNMPSRPAQQDKSTSAPTPVKNSAQKRRPTEELKPRPPPVNYFKLPAKPQTTATSVQSREEAAKAAAQPITRRGRPGPVLPREVVERKDVKAVQEIRADLSKNQLMSQAYEAAFYDLNFKTLEEIASKKVEKKEDIPRVSQELKPAKKLEITTQSLINYESKPIEIDSTQEEIKTKENDIKAEKMVEKVPEGRSTPTQQSAKISFFAENKQDILFEDPGFVDSDEENEQKSEKSSPPETKPQPDNGLQPLKPGEIDAPTSPHFGNMAQTIFPFQQPKTLTVQEKPKPEPPKFGFQPQAEPIKLSQQKPTELSKPEPPKFGFQSTNESLKSPEKPAQPPSTTLQLSPQSDNPFLNSSAIKVSSAPFVFGSGSQQSNPFSLNIQSANPFSSNAIKPGEAAVSNIFLPSSTSSSNPFITTSTSSKPNPFTSSYTSSQPQSSFSATFSNIKQDASGDIEMNSTPNASPKLGPAPYPAPVPPFGSTTNQNPFQSAAPPFPSSSVPPFPAANIFSGGSVGSMPNPFGALSGPFPGPAANTQSNGGSGSSFNLGVMPRKILRAKRP